MGLSLIERSNRQKGRGMKSLRLLIPVLLVIASIAMQVPAHAGPLPAGSKSIAVCLGTLRVNFTPGLRLTQGVVEYRTDPTAIQCLGAVEGAAITGTGSLSEVGRIEGTALGGRGAGTARLEIQTATGLKSVSFETEFVYGPGIGTKGSASILGPWIFMFLPTKGDALVTSVTEIYVVGQFVLQS